MIFISQWTFLLGIRSLGTNPSHVLGSVVGHRHLCIRPVFNWWTTASSPHRWRVSDFVLPSLMSSLAESFRIFLLNLLFLEHVCKILRFVSYKHEKKKTIVIYVSTSEVSKFYTYIIKLGMLILHWNPPYFNDKPNSGNPL